ncbi:hypothetical protein GDO81_007464 [Engystomops pustulosus]|uniref:Uncharacterized protein n=1 Tax=Engystomops pustulosus TaxID=76066 RepID=A0AAV7C8F7_ENGPU|nr:hypothetical protein GDO81_007464 [Engystomops pustulosus]
METDAKPLDKQKSPLDLSQFICLVMNRYTCSPISVTQPSAILVSIVKLSINENKTFKIYEECIFSPLSWLFTFLSSVNKFYTYISAQFHISSKTDRSLLMECKGEE